MTDYLPAIAIGTQVSSMTNIPADGVTAGGYSAFVLSLTGAPPSVQQLPNGRARLLLSPAQATLMGKWLDKQVGIASKILTTPASLDIDMSPVIIPFVMKYAIPAAVIFLTLGWIAHSKYGKKS
jgi:hypothetical protein